MPTATASETSPEPPRTKNFLDIVEYYAAFDAGGVVKDASGDFQVRFSRALLDNAGIKGISVPSSDLQSIHDTTVHRAYRFTHKARGSELVLGWAHAVIFGRLDRIVAFSVTKEEDLNIRLALIANGLRTATTGSDRGTLYMSDDTLFVLLPPHERLLDGVPEDWNRQDAGFRISAEFGRAYYFPVEAAIEGENIDRGPPTFEGVDLFGLNETNNYGKDGATGRVTIDYY